MTADWLLLTAAVVIVWTVAWTFIWNRLHPSASAQREQALSERVALLESQVSTLLNDRARDQQEITALRSELSDARLQIRLLRSELERSQASVGTAPPVLAPAVPVRSSGMLLVILGGTEQAFQRDLAQLRQAVRSTSHRLLVIPQATRQLVENVIDENRAAGTPVWGVHFGGHARPDGLALADGLADGQWLSETLGGTEVLVLAGCETFEVATWASVVPVRVSMLNKLETRAASIFTGAFWSPLCRGAEPGDAFAQALERSPARVAEYVQLVS